MRGKPTLTERERESFEGEEGRGSGFLIVLTSFHPTQIPTLSFGKTYFQPSEGFSPGNKSVTSTTCDRVWPVLFNYKKRGWDGDAMVKVLICRAA